MDVYRGSAAVSLDIPPHLDCGPYLYKYLAPLLDDVGLVLQVVFGGLTNVDLHTLCGHSRVEKKWFNIGLDNCVESVSSVSLGFSMKNESQKELASCLPWPVMLNADSYHDIIISFNMTPAGVSSTGS